MHSRYFAIAPAAGHSTRMGEPKLLLALAGRPLIQHAIDAWQRSRVERIFVVVRPGDESLASVVGACGIDVVVPSSPPPDMKASVQAALRQIEEQLAPTADDAFLVAPADMPRLSSAIINRLIERHAATSGTKILAPTINGKKGHPVLFAWPLAADVFALGANEGLDAIVHRRPPNLIPCEDLPAAGEYPFADIDTPEDYRKMANE